MREAAATGVARPFRVAVVGGGISGLSTAWYVKRQAVAQGVPVECSVYEAADRWGGRIRTDIVEREEGCFVVEGGPDSFLAAQKPWAVDLALELGLEEELLGTNDAARKVYVLSKGRPVPMPEGVFLLVPTKFKPFILSPLISRRGKMRMALEILIPAREGPADETLGDFVTRRFGAEALDKIAEPLLSGIYNAEAERQSLLATFPRFRETELAHGSLIRGMLAGKAQARQAGKSAKTGKAAEGSDRRDRRAGLRGSRDTVASDPAQISDGDETRAVADRRPSSIFVSFVAGTEEIVSALTRRLGSGLKAGVEVVRLAPVEQGRYDLEVSGGPAADAPGHAIQADAVVLAIPAYDAARLLASVCPEAAGLLGSIRYVSTGTVSLAYQRDTRSEKLAGFGVLVPRSERKPLNAVTWSSTKFDHRAPADCSLLRVFFGGSRSPGSMQLDDDELIDVVKRELKDIMGIDRDPLFHRIYRWEMANAQYDVEHLRLVEAVEKALPAGIWVTGSAYRGVGLPDCVHQGQAAAEQVIERLKVLQRSQ